MSYGHETVAFCRFYTLTIPRESGTITLFAIIFLFAMVTNEPVLYRMSYLLDLVIVGTYVCVRLKLWRLDMLTENKSCAVEKK
ncbi:MAG: hypothetical protein ACUVTR_00585 [Dehalococcoidia bacterium]